MDAKLEISQIQCINLRFYDPDDKLVKRAEALVRFNVGKLNRKTSVHEKSANPSWQSVSMNLDAKHKTSLLKCEVWHVSNGSFDDCKPLGSIQFSLSQLKQNQPYNFSGALTHVQGTFPPPDRLPPMMISLRICWINNTTLVEKWPINSEITTIMPLSTVSKNMSRPLTQREAYKEIRKLFPKVSKKLVYDTLLKSDFDLSVASDMLVDGLLGTIVESSPIASNLRITGMCMSMAFSQLNNSFLYHLEQKPHEEPADNCLLRNRFNPDLETEKLDNAGYIDSTKYNGQRKALLIGINYKGTKKVLNGCHDDVERMRRLVVDIYGFPMDPNFMTVLTDDTQDKRLWPTRKNILLACQWLVHETKPGDVLYFHYSGHGSQQKDLHGTENDGFDETIMPMDYRTKGHILDDELFEALVHPLPSGVKLFALMDCCHSGSGLDLPFVWDIERKTWRTEMCPKYARGDVILFSGCQDEQTSADVHIPRWGSGGAMTMSLVTTLAQDPYDKTYTGLISHVYNCMKSRGLDQMPQMSSTQKFDIDRNYDFTNIFKNINKFIGQDMRESKNASQRAGRTYIPKPMRVSNKKKRKTEA